MMISIRVNSGPTQQMLQRWIRMGKSDRKLTIAATAGVVNALQAHFLAKEKEPNKRGWKRSHYWRFVHDSTKATRFTDKVGEVTIAHPGYTPRFTTKRITAGKSISKKTGKPTVYMAIPAASESATIFPLQFEQTTGIKLFFTPLDSQTGLLQGYTSEKIPGRKKKGEPKTKEGSRIFYVLKKSIVQPADPSWFPKQSELEEGARVELDNLFRRELK